MTGSSKIAYPAPYRQEAIQKLHPLVIQMVCRLPEQEQLYDNLLIHDGQKIDYTVWTRTEPLPRLWEERYDSSVSAWCILRQFDYLIREKYENYLTLRYSDHGHGLQPRFYLTLADGINLQDLL